MNLFGPKNRLGLHRSLKTGSNRIRIPLWLPCEVLAIFNRNGNSTRKQACPNHVALILSAADSELDVSAPQFGLRTESFWAIGRVSFMKRVGNNLKAYNQGQGSIVNKEIKLKKLYREPVPNSMRTKALPRILETGSCVVDPMSGCVA